MNDVSSNIFVVMVFYNPIEEDIKHAQMLSERYDGVVVDNSNSPSCDSSMFSRFKHIANNENLGIAEAQNKGIAEALKNNNTQFVVFIDQDSRLAPDYPEKIAEEFADISKTHMKLAMLGPTIINKETNEAYQSVFHPDNSNERFTRRREIISSGSCMSREAIEKVGVNNSRMFIDYVDFDWCWRANAAAAPFVCARRLEIAYGNKTGSQVLLLSFPRKGWMQVLEIYGERNMGRS